MPARASLQSRLADRLRHLGLHGTGARVMVAVSGGADSVALLHLLRFAAGDAGVTVLAAHCDHAMRPESGDDARWVAGLCAAWGIPCSLRRASTELRGEAAARAWRYGALREMMREAGATHVATAHHADDQAETVLFRVLRGAGIEGLAGIPEAAGSLVRPLLPVWRSELRAYAHAHRLRWRHDTTNAGDRYARNRIRRLLPVLERRVAPGARRSLVRLAALARGDAAAWSAILDPLERAAVREEEGALLLVRSELAGYDSAVAARLLRRVLRRAGAAPGAQGTLAALQFITAAPSGRTLQLPGGVRIRAEFAAARVERAAADVPPDRPLAIEGARGSGAALLGGRPVRVEWRTEAAVGGDASLEGGVRLDVESLRGPLVLRGWRAGDRIRTRAGTRKLKKLLGERRVPLFARSRLAVLADAEGRVVWAEGLAQDPHTLPREGAASLLISMG